MTSVRSFSGSAVALHALLLAVVVLGACDDAGLVTMPADLAIDQSVVLGPATDASVRAAPDLPPSDCLPQKLVFKELTACLHAVELQFCIDPSIAPQVQAIAPRITCRAGAGDAACDPSSEWFCSYPLHMPPPDACTADATQLTDAARTQLCQLTGFPSIREIVPVYIPD